MNSWQQKWQVVRHLGAGGQGSVDLVVSAARATERQAALQKIVNSIEFITPRARDHSETVRMPAVADELAAAISAVSRSPFASEMAALKQLHLPTVPEERKQAMGRLTAEVRAMRELADEAAVLKLLDADEEEGWIATEYHEGGTLADHRQAYVGDALQALRAFEPLVAAVARLHEKKVIHRDIKPDNVFRSNENKLVLGDFGIVFWADESLKRLTETYERVGSRDWMAPWANRGRRLGDVNPTFDVFPLGKLLWSMVSGQHELPYWYWSDKEHNLEELFPDDPGMYWINSRILAHTVVEREAACTSSAGDLLARVRGVTSLLKRDGQRVTDPKRPCRVCGIGHYVDVRGRDPQIIAVLNAEQAERLNQAEFVYKSAKSRMTVRVQACNHCGHVQFFQFADGLVPSAWAQTS